MTDYLGYVRDPANGYLSVPFPESDGSVAFPESDGQEMSCRALRPRERLPLLHFAMYCYWSYREACS